jgi:hypothetical protein
MLTLVNAPGFRLSPGTCHAGTAVVHRTAKLSLVAPAFFLSVGDRIAFPTALLIARSSRRIAIVAGLAITSKESAQPLHYGHATPATA